MEKIVVQQDFASVFNALLSMQNQKDYITIEILKFYKIWKIMFYLQTWSVAYEKWLGLLHTIWYKNEQVWTEINLLKLKTLQDDVKLQYTLFSFIFHA